MNILNLYNHTRTFKGLSLNTPTIQNLFFSFKKAKQPKKTMDQVLQKFDILWQKSLIMPNDHHNRFNNTNPNLTSQLFHRARLDSSSYRDMLDYLKKEFYNSKQNIFEAHLYLIESAIKIDNHKDQSFKFAKAAFINLAFTEFHNQQKNICRRLKIDREANNEVKLEAPHLVLGCTELGIDRCICVKDETILFRAFELATGKSNLNMLSSFNKIYNFGENRDRLMGSINECVQRVAYSDKAILIGELQLHDNQTWTLEKMVLPLMLMDKYPSIDDYIKNDENILLQVVDLCDSLCHPETNLRDITTAHNTIVARIKPEKFKTKIIAKYASGCLKRIKKSNLIPIKYKNIALQLRISQMRFLVNLRYDKWGGDPISFEAWSELVLDLVGEDENLQYKLLLELINYQKDVKTAHKFLLIFGVEKMLQRMPESTRDFYLNNVQIIDLECKDTTNVCETKKFYYPSDILGDENIRFVGEAAHFEEMLNYFEANEPKVIGLDCEWKPNYDLIDASNEMNKQNHASTLQIATRDRSYIIDVKFLIETLEPAMVNKFGDLILFNENLLKLGYSFQQDATKLALTFPTFTHKFSEFSEDVVNIDECVTEFQKNWILFPDLPDPAAPKDKKNRGGPKGLSELTRKCFGFPLNKSECLSNWDKRPLRNAQLLYGALDALVLIQIHDFIQDRCKKLDVEFNYASSKKSYF